MPNLPERVATLVFAVTVLNEIEASQSNVRK